MTDGPTTSPAGSDLPEPERVKRRRWAVSLIWLVPLIAAIAGIVLLVTTRLAAGPVIHITFQDAQGITAGKTEVKFKNVVIGKVEKVALSGNHKRVSVTVQLEKSAADFATDGSRFWVVRPRVGLGGISGLGTLFSGSYIGADTGGSDAAKTSFSGLETPPPLTYNEQGTTYRLTADALGSLGIGTPVYYRQLQVGHVVAYQLDDNGQGVGIQVFINAPYDRFVTKNTRFWNTSGVNISLGASGLKVNTESLASIVAGGITFQRPPYDKNNERAAADTTFTLFSDRATAMQPPDGQPLMLTMHFPQSVRGLAVGAPVDFLGIDLGEVTSISLDYDPKAKRFPADVTAVIYPQRIGKAHERFVKQTGNTDPGALISILIKHGLRAQLRTGNLLTGKLYVAMDFFPKATKVAFDPNKRPLELPTTAGSFDKLQQQVADIVDSLHAIPFDQIGKELNSNLKHLDSLLAQMDKGLTPDIHRTLKQLRDTLASVDNMLANDSPVKHNLNRAMVELGRAARSVRTLSDYLSRHPNALITGRDDDPPARQLQGAKP